MTDRTYKAVPRPDRTYEQVQAPNRTDKEIWKELEKISAEMTEFDETNMSADDLREMRTRLSDRLQELSQTTTHPGVRDRAIGMGRALDKIVQEALDDKEPGSGGGGGGVTVKPYTRDGKPVSGYTRSKSDLVDTLDRINRNMRAISRKVKAI